MKIALITSVFGSIDTPKEIPEQTVRFIHHEFNEITFPDRFTKDRLKSLYFKTQHHKEIKADVYLYIDGKIQITSPDFVQQCVEQLGNNEMAFMKHLYRKCIYKEVDHIEHCIRKGNEYLRVRYANKPIRQEVESYRRQGYPANNGLSDCCIFIRRNSAMSNAIFDSWWRNVLNLDAFDQINIQFVAWKHGVKIAPLIFKKGSFIDVPHNQN